MRTFGCVRSGEGGDGRGRRAARHAGRSCQAVDRAGPRDSSRHAAAGWRDRAASAPLDRPRAGERPASGAGRAGRDAHRHARSGQAGVGAPPPGGLAPRPRRAAHRLRPPQPPAQRLPALLHDRHPRLGPRPGAAPAQGPGPPGADRLAVPATRRRPHGAGVRERRLPGLPLQPVRLLRGRPGLVSGLEDGDLPSSFAEAVAALQARGRFGIRLGLGRTRALLAALGHPEQGIRGALIAGTNGKGSVVALVGACLVAAGYRAGETPKPHLVSYRERVRIAGHPITATEFARLVRDGLPVADVVARRHGPPTEFELLTALAFRHVEVGLGGRLDATHAWDGGVAVITNVDLDHTEHLGPTVEAIAREKAAIIMPGDLAITGAAGPGLGPIRRRARRAGVSLVEVSAAPVLASDWHGLLVDLPGLGAVRVSLLGRHQAANVAIADAVLDALGRAGIAQVGPDARRTGYAAARWPGRLELLDLPGAGPRGA